MPEQLPPHDVAHVLEQARAREAIAAELVRDLPYRPETLSALEGHVHDAAAAFERAGDAEGAKRVRALLEPPAPFASASGGRNPGNLVLEVPQPEKPGRRRP